MTMINENSHFKTSRAVLKLDVTINLDGQRNLGHANLPFRVALNGVFNDSPEEELFWCYMTFS